MAKVVIEVSGVHGVRQEYHSFDQPVIRVGRGYHNDLIVTDPYISVEHVIFYIDEDRWLVEDRGSENGTYLNDSAPVSSQHDIRSGDFIVVGETRLRIFAAGHPVKPAQRLQRFNKIYRRLSHPVFAAGALLSLFLFNLGEAYLSSWEKGGAEKLLAAAMGNMFVILIWAGFWAFVGRLIKHRAYYSVQIVITALVAVALLAVLNITSYLGFYTSSGALEVVSVVVAESILSVVLLSSNLSVATNLSRKKRVIGTSVFTFLILTISLLGYFIYISEFNAMPDYYSELKPPFIKISSKTTVEQFIENSSDIFVVKGPPKGAK